MSSDWGGTPHLSEKTCQTVNLDITRSLGEVKQRVNPSSVACLDYSEECVQYQSDTWFNHSCCRQCTGQNGIVVAKQHYPEPTVGALIFDPEGNLFLMRSHKWHDNYVVPGGHIELGERMEDALKREVKEETGLDIYDIELLCIQEFIYDDTFWERKHFIFFDFVCKANSKKVTLNDEAYDYTWISLQRASELPIDPYTKVAIEKYLAKIET